MRYSTAGHIIPLNTYHDKLDLYPCNEIIDWNSNLFFLNCATGGANAYQGPRSGKAIPLRRNSWTQSVRSSIGNGSILAFATIPTKYSTKCVLSILQFEEHHQPRFGWVIAADERKKQMESIRKLIHLD